MVDSSSRRDDVATRATTTTAFSTNEGSIRASRLDLVLAACALEGETASAVRRGLARATADADARETALTRLTADARAFEASASALERGLSRRMESKRSNASIDGRRGRWRRCGGSSSRRTRRRARSTSRARSSNLDDDGGEETTGARSRACDVVELERAREEAESDDEDVDGSLDAAARGAAARFLRRALASGREYARESHDDERGLVSDIVRPVLASNSTEDVERWLRAGFDALGRFASLRRRGARDASNALRPNVVFDIVLDEDDASQLAKWDEETSAKARARVVSWLDDRREFDSALAELESLRAHDDGAASSVRLIQRRELLVRAIESWRDFRDVVVALQLGAEEFRHAERTVRLARRASRADADRDADREDADREDDDASNARWRRAFHECALAYATRVPTAVETREAARACVMRVRAVNACDVPVPVPPTPMTSTSTSPRRVIDAAYADRDVDVTALLADAARDLRDARDAVVRETRARAGECRRARERALDRDHAGRAIRPLVERYESSALGAIVDRVIRAVETEREIEEEGELFARCALFARCVAEPLRAHVATMDDEALEAALRAFEEEDAGATVASATVTTKRKKKGKRRASSRSGTEPPPPPPPNRPIESPATSDVDDDAREEDDRCDARADVRESMNADESLVGWTTARARRKQNAAASAKTRARSRSPPPPPRPVAVGVSARPRPLPPVAPTPSLGLSARPDFPPKPKPVASRRVEFESSKTPKTPKTPPKTPPLRSVGEYRRMLNTESERERESRLRDFPELKTRSSPAVNTAEVRRAPSRIPPPRAFATPANANAKTPPPPPPRKTWAEAKRAIDGVKLPSLIKIK